ncbi:MATE family efflux transporter [Clostridium folliculivorans]|uniref:MATE family efflux transporter n=1 Tax=Clostridium folliculivorans TaxID=2886038 RepID=A0A9W5Y059_9CLOT|nr:MATE family efflux transporter [Clostridium folliculivorans]GKU24187.1 MATE family efflux transporter [Clostridium folliculivorans]GKU30292.1 MATE family efflux transporter [Clostridium folliculivorans]
MNMNLSFLRQNTEERRDLILNGPILSTLFLLSIPTLMMGLVQSIIPVMDGIFINNIVGTIGASAITYSGPIINMAIALSQGLSVAAIAMIGQMNGRGHYKRAKYVSTQVVVFAFLIGIITAPILYVLAFPISSRVDPQISHDVFLYLSLNSMVLPFLFLEAIYNSIKNANGKPEATFIRMMLMLVLKFIFNVLFIVVFPLGLVGSVISSFAANLIICIWMFYELFVKAGDDKLILRGFKFDFKILFKLIKIGIPSMISSLMLSLGFFLINNEIEKYGPIVLTGQGIAGNITSVCFILPSAFGSAVTTMVSMNVGAGQGDKARKSCIEGCIVSAITAALLIITVVPLSPYLTVLFTNKHDVLEIANKSLHIYTYSVIGFGICMVEQGAFIGLGRTGIPLIMGFLRIWLLRYVFILATEHVLSFYSVFWGNLFSNYMAAIITTVLIMRIKWVSALSKKESKRETKKLASV